MRKLAFALATNRSSSVARGEVSNPSRRRCPVSFRASEEPRDVVGTLTAASATHADRRGQPLRVREVQGSCGGDGDGGGRGNGGDGGDGGGGDGDGDGDFEDRRVVRAARDLVDGDDPDGAASFHWVLEESSTSTRENALYALEECVRRGWSEAVVVTNRFHQWRAGRVFIAAAEELRAARVSTRAKEEEGGSSVVRVRVARMPPELEVRMRRGTVGRGVNMGGVRVVSVGVVQNLYAFLFSITLHVRTVPLLFAGG